MPTEDDIQISNRDLAICRAIASRNAETLVSLLEGGFAPDEPYCCDLSEDAPYDTPLEQAEQLQWAEGMALIMGSQLGYRD